MKRWSLFIISISSVSLVIGRIYRRKKNCLSAHILSPLGIVMVLRLKSIRCSSIRSSIEIAAPDNLRFSLNWITLIALCIWPPSQRVLALYVQSSLFYFSGPNRVQGSSAYVSPWQRVARGQKVDFSTFHPPERQGCHNAMARRARLHTAVVAGCGSHPLKCHGFPIVRRNMIIAYNMSIMRCGVATVEYTHPACSVYGEPLDEVA